MLDFAAPGGTFATTEPPEPRSRGRHAARRAHAAAEQPAGRPRPAVLIPAPNEQDRIAAALEGL